MRLTLHADFALRVLIYAGLKGNTLSTIPKLAQHFDIPKGHLMKVVHRLARLGYLHTSRGKGGGMRLARDAAAINLGAVVRDMETELGVVGCLQDEPGYCRIEGCCVLQSILREATEAFLAHSRPLHDRRPAAAAVAACPAFEHRRRRLGKPIT